MGRRGDGSGLPATALLLLLALVLGEPRAAGSREVEGYTALVSTASPEPLSSATTSATTTIRGAPRSGRSGDKSPKERPQGLPSGPSGPGTARKGCAPDTRYYVPRRAGRAAGSRPEPWTAPGAHGQCTSKDKGLRPASSSNSSAMVLYKQERYGNYSPAMLPAGTGDMLVIVFKIELWVPVQRGIAVKMTIEVGTRHLQETLSRRAVLLAAMVLITMMIISLGWLISYYVQHFRSIAAHCGPQNSRKDTRPAGGPPPPPPQQPGAPPLLRRVKHGSMGAAAEDCVVCIENHPDSDSLRVLPCKHVFHRACIDPWLLDHRTCPVCKLDVSEALPYWGDVEGPRRNAPRAGAMVSVAVPDPDGGLASGSAYGPGLHRSSFHEEMEETEALLDSFYN